MVEIKDHIFMKNMKNANDSLKIKLFYSQNEITGPSLLLYFKKY